MPPKPAKPGEKKGAAEPEPVPMDPKAASRVIGRHIEKQKTSRIEKKPSAPAAAPPAKSPGRPVTAATRRASGSREPETKIFVDGIPPRLAAANAKAHPRPAPSRAAAAEEPDEEAAEAPPAPKAPVRKAAAPTAPGRAAPPPPAKAAPPPARRAAAPQALAPERPPPAEKAPAPPPPSPRPRPAPAEEAPAAEPAPAPPAPAPPPPPEAAPLPEEILRGSPIDNRVLLALLEDTPGSLQEVWIRIQSGDDPEKALKVSKTEVEFLLLQKTLLE